MNGRQSPSNTQKRLEGKVAVVTGAGRGIGESIALHFAQEGAMLVLASRTLTELRRVANSLPDTSPVEIVVTDVSDRSQVEALIRAAICRYGKIDIVVNAAGTYGPIGPLWENDSESWAQAIAVNVLGSFHVAHAAVPHMVEARKGKIIFFSGGGAASPLPRFSAYAVSKCAVVRLTENLAEELREFSICVNAIAPGMVDTALQDQVIAAGEKAGPLFERMRRARATGEGATPRELPAELAVFLASHESDGLSGRLISAPFDDWRSWDHQRAGDIMAESWFTLRRMDPFTLKPLIQRLATASAAADGQHRISGGQNSRAGTPGLAPDGR